MHTRYVSLFHKNTTCNMAKLFSSLTLLFILLAVCGTKENMPCSWKFSKPTCKFVHSLFWCSDKLGIRPIPILGMVPKKLYTSTPCYGIFIHRLLCNWGSWGRDAHHPNNQWDTGGNRFYRFGSCLDWLFNCGVISY